MRSWTVRLDRVLTMLAGGGLIAALACDAITAPAPRGGCNQEDPDVLMLMASGWYSSCRFGLRLGGRLLRRLNGGCERLLAAWTRSAPADWTLLMDDLDFRLAEMKRRP